MSGSYPSRTVADHHGEARCVFRHYMVSRARLVAGSVLLAHAARLFP